jgi:hypothetical protein
MNDQALHPGMPEILARLANGCFEESPRSVRVKQYFPAAFRGRCCRLLCKNPDHAREKSNEREQHDYCYRFHDAHCISKTLRKASENRPRRILTFRPRSGKQVANMIFI